MVIPEQLVVIQSARKFPSMKPESSSLC